MEDESLLKRSSSSDSIPSSGDETLVTSPKHNELFRAWMLARVCIEVAILSCLVVLICLLAGILWTERDAEHNSSKLAGSDLSGVVPLG
jgi:hypothetical protein